MKTPDDPQIYACEQCGEDILEQDIVEYGEQTFCSQECADQWELEDAGDDADA